jgi:DNA helicase II / ATP-dependent DNA helicase PcrA
LVKIHLNSIPKVGIIKNNRYIACLCLVNYEKSINKMALKLVKETQSTRSELNDESPILKGLNPEQKEAVITIDGPLLIVAGAGSGKTRVLTHRIAYLIEKGVPPYSILALTFTNKAAKEMKERIARIVAPDAANQVWAGTFHSIFSRILRREAEILGYTNNFSIYDSEDSLKMIRHTISSLGISHQEFPAQGMQSRISWSKNQMISWQEYTRSAENFLQQQTALVFQEYEKEMKNNNAMDFDDLLLNMIALLKNSNDTLERYQSRFKYIMVDEYQDTNRAQYIAVKMLADKHKNLCVVGDDAQSIYRWRGADIRNILDYQKDYQKSKIIRLEMNYRSTKMILKAAGSVIKNNKNQIPKTLRTDNPEGEHIEILSCPDDRAEAEKIVYKINQNIDKDFQNKDFAILYRTNAQSLALENAFRSAKIPYMIVGGFSFYKRKEIKDTIAYLKLLSNPKDSESLLRIINEPPRGLGAVSIGHVQNFAKKLGIPLFEALGKVNVIPELQPRAKMSFQDLSKLINENIQNKENKKLTEYIINYIEQTGILQMYQDIGTEDALDRWNNIQQLLSDISVFFRNNEELNLEDYLEQISLISDIDEADTSENKVALMTLHSAKGLEFPVVFIAGLEEDLFPFARSANNPDEMEEERRLFYVGITRAQEKLYLSYAQKRMRFGEIMYQSPSCFLNEIDSSCIKFAERKSIRNEERPEPIIINGLVGKIPRPKSESYSQIPEPEFNFRVGDKVKHSLFGIGQIKSLNGTGTKAQAAVYFPPIGIKKLMLQYAKLELMQRGN